MKLRAPLSVLLVSVLFGSSGGCSCRSSERVSATVTSPVGRWVSAFATVEYHPSFSKGGRTYAPSVLHSLSIRETDQNRSYVILAQRSEEEVSPSQFRELRDMAYTLRFSPDDHLLAASTDGGKAWTLFDLESLGSPTDEPFWCRHRSVPSLDPWPTMDGLAVEILASVDPLSPGAAVHRSPTSVAWPGSIPEPRGTYPWTEEVDGAFRHACFHKEDKELRAAVIAAYFQKDLGYIKSDVAQCVGEIAKTDPAIKVRLEEMVSNGNRDGQLRAKSALGYISQPSPGPYKPPVPIGK